jgi:hypothetical protein
MSTRLGVPTDVRWYTPEEGGRRSGPPLGPTYAATGLFAGQPLEDMFSVVLNMTSSPSAGNPYWVTGVLSPGFPENVPDFAQRLQRGERLFLHEGRRAVAECVVSVPTQTEA